MSSFINFYIRLLAGAYTNELQRLLFVQTRNYLSLEQLSFTMLRVDG